MKEVLRPLGNRIVVRRDTKKSATDGGILLPDTLKDAPTRGTVVAVGPGKYDVGLPATAVNGTMSVRPGDTVLFTSYAGSEVTVGDDTVLVMSEDDVLCVVEPAK